ncbi:hypothetical protein [Spirillospora sp. NPDC029432]|uniref:hypothetical protein n=1 Tax=Spirillospora sp. NPDC029432 TaxID=3154599 RepID=UPI003452EC19
MISLKAAVIAASAVGAVAAGGVTWASVAQPEAAPVSANGQLPDAVKKAKPSAPAVPTPTCVPASDLAKKGEQAARKGAGDLPDVKGQLPSKNQVQVPGAEVPAKPDARLPEGKLPKGELPKAELPPCPETGAGDNARKPGAKLPEAKKPEVKVPAVTAPDCAKLAPAVEVGGPVERAIMLPKGLKYASATKAPKELRAKNICAVTQKWVSRAGSTGWITVERIQAPAGMEGQRLRQALKLPQGGKTTNVNGAVVWQAPAGQSGVLVASPDGGALFVNGSPVYQGGLQDLATKIAQTAK